MSSRGSLEIERVAYEEPKLLVYRLKGVLTDVRECYDFLEELRGDVQSGYQFLALNVEHITRVTSAGVGIIAACFTSVANAGGKMCVVGATDRVRTLMEIVGLWSVLDHCDCEEDAIARARG